jgi:hypothetical protein
MVRLSYAVSMTEIALQVQFDPSAARFGEARSQKRLEDERLLTGKGRYGDDLKEAKQAPGVIAVLHDRNR